MSTLSLDRTERRIIGVLIEKQMTTPEYYPMTLNALRDGCNQKNNRDPVMNLQDFEVDGALRNLFMEQWAANVTQPGGRALKWKHRAEEKLALEKRELAVMCELLLRGAQQPGELRAHASRLAAFPALEDLEAVLTQLASKGLVVNLGRRAGERAPRYDHTLYRADEGSPAEAPGGHEAAAPPASIKTAAREPSVQAPVAPAASRMDADLVVRVQALERQIREMNERIERLEDGLGS